MPSSLCILLIFATCFLSNSLASSSFRMSKTLSKFPASHQASDTFILSPKVPASFINSVLWFSFPQKNCSLSQPHIPFCALNKNFRCHPLAEEVGRSVIHNYSKGSVDLSANCIHPDVFILCLIKALILQENETSAISATQLH